MRRLFLTLIFLVGCAAAPVENFDEEGLRRALAPTLIDKQQLFAQEVARLVQRAKELGYAVTLGEAWRSAEQAKFQTKLNAEKGIGIANSLHTVRIAIDLNLFREGELLTKTEDYKVLGEWWERQSNGGIMYRWGGRFKRADGNHFSFEHGGVQ